MTRAKENVEQNGALAEGVAEKLDAMDSSVTDDRERPTFDFSKVGYGWDRKYRHEVGQIMAATAILRSQPRRDLTAEQAADLAMKQSTAYLEMDEAVERRDALLTQVLVDVPRSWLIPDAPEEIDWKQTESLDYIRDMNAVVQALGEARNPGTRPT